MTADVATEGSILERCGSMLDRFGSVLDGFWICLGPIVDRFWTRGVVILELPITSFNMTSDVATLGSLLGQFGSMLDRFGLVLG